MKSICYNILVLLAIIFLSSGCNSKENKFSEPLFKNVSTDHSKLFFSNDIQENDTLNYLNFPYIYMGGGVAVGDFNNDGLSDIFVTGNMVKNKLYLNKGDFVFKDISVQAGVEGDNRWYTGIALVDINHDGFLDIYLSVSGKNTNTRNQLYINNGDLTFTEKAAEYGIDDASTSIQSTFFDYDRDGDLDLFVANYPLVPLTQGNLFYATLMKNNNLSHSGHLYQNQGNHFVDVTYKAGVQNFGLTLGLSSVDVNNYGWPDLYLSNDFNVPDYLYINNQDGTFKEVIKSATGHTSMFGMGIDVADFNNDGLMDIVQADMTPEDYTRAKVNMASMSTASFWKGVDLGFHYQYMQNSLQVNNGVNSDNIPLFSEVSRLAGIATTDWSWSTLFLDMDNDGWKDIYITNGMKRDVNDNDLNQRTGATTFQAAFNQRDISEYPSEPLVNYAFKNKGDFTFEKTTKNWGLAYESFSNGMAYGDLDNDGDLDLVINNLDQKLSLYQNNSNDHFLRIKLNGPDKNPMGIGTRITLESSETGHLQTEYLSPTKGFQSSVEPIIHFGLRPPYNEQRLIVTWPDGKQEIQTITTFDRLIKVDYENAVSPKNSPTQKIGKFVHEASSLNLNFEHEEDNYNDYRYEPLLPHKYSTIGPGMAVADINGDGLDDFYVGNAKNSEAKLFRQTEKGTFDEIKGPWQKDGRFEDTGALFFDADADGDQDLYIVSGGNHKGLSNDLLQDRLYMNDAGDFVVSQALPSMPISGKTVRACDYDKDGDQDLFIGGRLQPGLYPQPPQSYLLRNDGGKGAHLKFSDATQEVSKKLSKTGMVTDAIWVDVDGDSWKDLVVVGEWMPITLFRNQQGKLVEETEKWSLDQNVGWWYGLKAMDVDNDGDMDLVAGNLGLNYKYKATPEKPFEIFLNDFDKNGSQDIVLGVHKEGRLLPLRGRECSSQQIPAIRVKYETYREFAAANLADIYGAGMLDNSTHYKATTFAHYWLENSGKGNFKWHVLPNQSQFFPINTIQLFDYDGDDYTDLLVFGGLYDAEVETPRADAGLGLVLKNKAGKGFETIPPSISGLMVRGDVRDVKPISINKQKGYILAKNNDSLEVVLIKDK